MWSLGSATDDGKLGRSSRGGESGSCNAAQHTEGVTLITEVVTIEEGVPEYKCISFQGYKKKNLKDHEADVWPSAAVWSSDQGLPLNKTDSLSLSSYFLGCFQEVSLIVLQRSSLNILVLLAMVHLFTSSNRNAKLTTACGQNSLTYTNDSLPAFGKSNISLDLLLRLENVSLSSSVPHFVSKPQSNSAWPGDWQPLLKQL